MNCRSYIFCYYYLQDEQTMNNCDSGFYTEDSFFYQNQIHPQSLLTQPSDQQYMDPNTSAYSSRVQPFFDRNPVNSTTKFKIHKCSFCSYESLFKNDVVKHERTHTKEKPFTCDQCNLSFSQLSNLNTHRRIHSGGNAFKCNFCSFSSNRNKNLKLHIRNVHKKSM